MPYKRRSNAKIIFLKALKVIGVLTALFMSVFVITMIVKSLLTKEKTATKPIQIAQVDIQEPDASSEMGGKYYGLCKKNSIHSVEDFKKTVQRDATLANHFADFNWDSARIGKLDHELWTYVAYRRGETIQRTSKPVRLPKGDGYITDGTRTVRTFCCNDYVVADPPRKVTEAPPTEQVAGPPRRIGKALDEIDLQQSSGAIPEESGGDLPKATGKKPSRPDPRYTERTYLYTSDATQRRYSSPTNQPVPEPGTIVLMGIGAGAFGLVQIIRRKKKIIEKISG